MLGSALTAFTEYGQVQGKFFCDTESLSQDAAEAGLKTIAACNALYGVAIERVRVDKPVQDGPGALAALGITPGNQFDSKAAEVVVIDMVNVGEVEQMVSRIRQLCPRGVAWDLEWVSARISRGSPHPVSLMVIAPTHALCYLVRIRVAGCQRALPLALKNLLQDPAIPKVGVHIKSDNTHFLKVYPDCPVSPLVELSDLANKFLTVPKKPLHSLDDIVRWTVHKRMNKSSADRLSNWEAPILSQTQVTYAAEDGLGSFLAFLRFRELEGRTSMPAPVSLNCPTPFSVQPSDSVSTETQRAAHASSAAAPAAQSTDGGNSQIPFTTSPTQPTAAALEAAAPPAQSAHASFAASSATLQPVGGQIPSTAPRAKGSASDWSPGTKERVAASKRQALLKQPLPGGKTRQKFSGPSPSTEALAPAIHSATTNANAKPAGVDGLSARDLLRFRLPQPMEAAASGLVSSSSGSASRLGTAAVSSSSAAVSSSSASVSSTSAAVSSTSAAVTSSFAAVSSSSAAVTSSSAALSSTFGSAVRLGTAAVSSSSAAVSSSSAAVSSSSAAVSSTSASVSSTSAAVSSSSAALSSTFSSASRLGTAAVSSTSGSAARLATTSVSSSSAAELDAVSGEFMSRQSPDEDEDFDQLLAEGRDELDPSVQEMLLKVSVQLVTEYANSDRTDMLNLSFLRKDQRSQVHDLAVRLGLGHLSMPIVGTEEKKLVIYRTKGGARPVQQRGEFKDPKAVRCGMDETWRCRINKDWADGCLDYDHWHYQQNFLLMAASKASGLFKYYARCLSNVMFKIMEGEKERVGQYLRKRSLTPDQIARLPRSYWRGEARWVCPAPEPLGSELIDLALFFSELIDPETGKSFFVANWKALFKKEMGYVLAGYLSDPPHLSMYVPHHVRSSAYTILLSYIVSTFSARSQVRPSQRGCQNWSPAFRVSSWVFRS